MQVWICIMTLLYYPNPSLLTLIYSLMWFVSPLLLFITLLHQYIEYAGEIPTSAGQKIEVQTASGAAHTNPRFPLVEIQSAAIWLPTFYSVGQSAVVNIHTQAKIEGNKEVMQTASTTVDVGHKAR